LNRFKSSLDEDWYDSNSYESIQSKSESFMIRFTEIWVDSGKKEVKNRCWQHLNWFRLFVNRFSCESIQENSESIHYESIQENCESAILFKKSWLDLKGETQGKWTKGMLDMNQWIMNRIKQFTDGFFIYDNTQDIKESQDNTQDIKETHDTMKHDLLGCFKKFLS